MRVCQLNGTEVKMLEERGCRPDCSRHPHLRSEEAERFVESKTFRYVGTKKSAVTRSSDGTGTFYDRIDCSNRPWAVRRSGMVSAVQLTHDARVLGRKPRKQRCDSLAFLGGEGLHRQAQKDGQP